MKTCINCGELIGDNADECFKCHYNYKYKRVISPQEIRQKREQEERRRQLGYVIGVPYQRKGYATEVCTAILAYAGEELSLPFINCLIEEGNTVSEHVAQRLGFAPAGELLLDGKRMKKYRYRLF